MTLISARLKSPTSQSCRCGEFGLHLTEHLFEGENALRDIDGFFAFLVARQHPRTSSGIADIVKATVALLLRHGTHLVAEHRGETDLACCLEHALVDVLAPNPHARAVKGRRRRQRRIWKCLIDIFADQRRLDDRPSLVDQRGHYTLGIEAQIFRPILLIVEKIDVFRFPIETLFTTASETPFACKWNCGP